MKIVRRVSSWVILVIVAACGGSNITAEQIQSVRYEYGDGEVGAAHTVVTIDRDGQIKYRRQEGVAGEVSHNATIQTEPETVETLFSRLAELNIGRLIDYEPQCCDIGVTTVTVTTPQGSESFAYQGIGQRDPHWEEVQVVLTNFVERLGLDRREPQ